MFVIVVSSASMVDVQVECDAISFPETSTAHTLPERAITCSIEAIEARFNLFEEILKVVTLRKELGQVYIVIILPLRSTVVGFNNDISAT